MKEEICKNCGRIIGIAEQAFVCKARIICEQCDKKLRAPLEVRTPRVRGDKLAPAAAGAAPARPRDSLLTGRRDPQKPEELLEFPELQASPVKIEQALEVSKPPTPKPLPHKRKRVSTTESTLLPLSLAAWSLLCLFLLFYVPGRYISMLEINPLSDEYQTVRFSVECLILFFMLLWFFGALALYVVIVGYDKEEKTSEKLRILKLLGF